jgi:hypothetical protein
MKELDPRIRTAMLSIHPTSEHRAWHGAPTVLAALRGVSSQVAVWRPYPGMISIRDIALHITYFENLVANRLSGMDLPVAFELRKRGWPVVFETLDDTQWTSEMDFMREAHEHLVEAVRSFDPQKLDQPPSKKTGRSAIEFIHGVAEHTLYHTAQMKMLKTLAKHAAVH